MSGSCIIQRRENIYDVSAHGKVWRMHDCVYKGIYIYIYGAKQLVVYGLAATVSVESILKPLIVVRFGLISTSN